MVVITNKDRIMNFLCVIHVIRFVLWEWQTKMCCGFTFATTKSRSIQYDFEIKSGEIKEVFLITLLRHYLNFS